MKILPLAIACAASAAVAAVSFVVTADTSPDATALRETANALFSPIQATVTEVRGQPISAEQVELGKLLFFEPRLSRSHVISCNTCHNVGTGGADNVPTSIGHGWQKGPRNSPTALNAVFNDAQFWDGRAEDLKAQAKGPIQAGVEMANTPLQVVETLKSMPKYVEWFEAAFPGEADPVTFDNMAKAIEAFEATLITPAPFDAYLNGDEAAMTLEQKQGLALFMDKGCASCHSGINLGGNGYYPFGLIEKPGAEVLPENDKGRFAVTATADDSYVFRAAPLRNVTLTAPYFHSGKVWNLRQAVAIMGTSQLGEDMSDDDVERIVAFLGSLEGRLPEVVYPVLPAETDETPLPSGEIK